MSTTNRGRPAIELFPYFSDISVRDEGETLPLYADLPPDPVFGLLGAALVHQRRPLGPEA